jgi:2-polyprenyl-3-methyl-5-hydroxy-6-metoxy-1,4-benzoquinol methylase
MNSTQSYKNNQDVDLNARHRIEEEFHDTKAREGVHDFYEYGALSFADSVLWNWMGDLSNKRLLEIGCGDGTATIRFANAGAIVTAIDISQEMVELTKKVSREHGVEHRVFPVHVGGEEINFPNESFDIIYGHSVLHHLKLDIAAPRIAACLKSGGNAFFLEPLDHNPLLNLFRLFTPHRRTPTEKPLAFSQIDAVAKNFSAWQHQEFYLLSLVAFFWYYVVRNKYLFQMTLDSLAKVDNVMFKVLPFLRRFAWVTLIKFER